MRINPINTTDLNYKANIKPTDSLKNSFNMIKDYAKSDSLNDLDYVKDFLDSLAIISESKKINEFVINIDKRRENHTYVKINNRRVKGGHNECLSGIKDEILTVEGTKCFAKKLETPKRSVCDYISMEIEQFQQKISELKEQYQRRLQSEIEKAEKIIFNCAE